MIEKCLSGSFGESLKENTVDIAIDYMEMGLDSVMEDGLLKDVPIVSTVVALYKVGNSFKERHNLKKLYIFIDEINKRIVNKERLNEYKEKFQANDKYRNKEIEYLLVLIDRYINYDKPQMLAKLYLAYLDGIIIWEELTMYAEVIDRFLITDCNMLVSDSEIFVTYLNVGTESFLRLVALGLMVDESNNSMFDDDFENGIAITSSAISRTKLKERKYKRTEFGQKLAEILR